MIINGYELSINNFIGVNSATQSKIGNSIGNSGNDIFGRDTLQLSSFFNKYADSDDETKSKIIEMLKEIDNNSDIYNDAIAKDSYIEMQRILKTEISLSKSDINIFNKYQDEKNYYQSLLDDSVNSQYAAEDDSIIIKNAQYDFKNLEVGASVTRDDVKSALSSLQQRIDDLVGHKNYITDSFSDAEELSESEVWESVCGIKKWDFSDRIEFEGQTVKDHTSMLRNIYNLYTDRFASATGIESPYLAKEDDDSLLFDVSDYTEENFVEKTNERIQNLSERTNNLKGVMHQYCQQKKIEDYSSRSKANQTIISDEALALADISNRYSIMEIMSALLNTDNMPLV